MPQTRIHTDLLGQSFVRALGKAWCAEIADPRLLTMNALSGPSKGCALVSALALWAGLKYRGLDAIDLVPGMTHLPGRPGIVHWRNAVVLDEPGWKTDYRGRVHIDLTWDQFPKGSAFHFPYQGTPRFRALHHQAFFADPTLPARLALLFTRMQRQGGYDIGMTPRQALEMARDAHARHPAAPVQAPELHHK